jgi:hypothetical protein
MTLPDETPDYLLQSWPAVPSETLKVPPDLLTARPCGIKISGDKSVLKSDT